VLLLSLVPFVSLYVLHLKYLQQTKAQELKMRQPLFFIVLRQKKQIWTEYGKLKLYYSEYNDIYVLKVFFGMYNWRNVDNHEGIQTYIAVRLGKSI